MSGVLITFGITALFVLGLRLSAFFSGAETGFYRASYLRLSLDAHVGDRLAERILWFARNPSYFVATTLVGNNVANYLTTLAVGMAAVRLVEEGSGWIEVAATLMISPVVFVCGELIPKNLYYRAPLTLLRRNIVWFSFFYRLFLAISFPLIWITKLFERIGNPQHEQRELVLGRSRLVQVLHQGHREGLLSDVQNRLVHGLLHTAAETVTASMTPNSRVFGVADDATPAEVLDFARRYGVPKVAVRRADEPNGWYGYVRAIDLAVTGRPVSSLIRTMPRIDASASKLEAMGLLREAGEAYGVVSAGGEVLGIVSEHGLVEQLFRPPAALGGRPVAVE